MHIVGFIAAVMALVALAFIAGMRVSREALEVDRKIAQHKHNRRILTCQDLME